MTDEELQKQLEHDLRVLKEYQDIKRRYNGRTPTAAHLVEQEHSRNGSTGSGAAYGVIGPAVIAAIKKCRKTYNVRDIHRILKRQNISKAQIATALRRFERQGKIKEVEHGSGRRPNKYTTVSL